MTTPSSIMRRLMLGLSLTVGMGCALAVALLATFTMRSERADLQRSIESSVAEAASALEAPLWDLDMDRAAKIGEAIAEDPRITRLAIRENASGTTSVVVRTQTTDTLWRTRQVLHEGVAIGEVGVAFSRDLYRAQVWRQVRHAVVVAIIALAATLFGVRLLVRRVLRRPLEDLSAVVTAYSEGRYLRSPASVTEFEPIFGVLHGMGDRITVQLDDLHAANALLEKEVGERRVAEESLRERHDQLATLNRFLALAAEEETPEGLLEDACKELSTAFRMSGGYAIMLDKLDATLTVVAPVGEAATALPAGLTLPLEGLHGIRSLLDARVPFIAPAAELESVAEAVRSLAPPGVRGIVGLPLVVAGAPVGAIMLTSPEPRRFSDADIALAAGIAAQTGSALARHRARAGERLLRAAIEQIPESVIMTDTTGRIEYVNAAFHAITGYESGEVIGGYPRILKSGKHDDAFYAGIWRALASEEPWFGRVCNRTKAGEHYYEDTVITPVRNERGVVAHYVSIARDITAELAREEKQLHAQKLEAIGLLAGGIAHDFNNIMGAMSMELELLELEALGDDVASGIRNVRNSVSRAAALTRQLLLFSRRQAMSVRQLDLNVVVSDVLQMLTRLIGEKVSVSFARADGQMLVDGDAGMFEQVLMNLCVNARDAMPDGGQLTIGTMRVELDEATAALHPGTSAGPAVCLSVSDTGAGMTADVQRHMFEPFFSTKGVGKGTGLGLATTHGIVAQHGGWIDVESDVGRGTTFRIYLPLIRSAPVQAPPEALPRMRRGDEVILVVEDEALIRSMVTRALRQLGYRVLEATSGVDAMDIWEREDRRIDLVLSDMVMPDGLSGIDLSARLKAMRPEVEVIIMSGYSVDFGMDGERVPSDVRFLGKPFTIAALSEVVRSALEQRRGAGAGN